MLSTSFLMLLNDIHNSLEITFFKVWGEVCKICKSKLPIQEFSTIKPPLKKTF